MSKPTTEDPDEPTVGRRLPPRLHRIFIKFRANSKFERDPISLWLHPIAPRTSSTMVGSSFPSYLMDALLHQEGETEPDIRVLSLATLNDDDVLSTAALFWTQFGWIWVLVITGWLWLLAIMATDLILFGVRWWVRRGWAMPGYRPNAVSAVVSAWNHLFWMGLISVEIFVLAQAPSEQTTILSIILAVGASGYVSALFAAFPLLATVNITMLNVGLGLGLAVGYSDDARPLALLSIGLIAGYWLVSRRSHASLLGAIRAQHANRRNALHDPLTKLPNRTLLREKLAHLLSLVGTQGGPAEIAVLCLDLDGFKEVNDRHGHATGDLVLVHVADILRNALQAGDMASRIGGDEYVVLLSGGGRTRARSVAETIISAVESPFDIGRAVAARIGVSIGAAISTDGTKSVDDLLKEADTALYGSKRSGKGRLQLNETSSPEPSSRNVTTIHFEAAPATL